MIFSVDFSSEEALYLQIKKQVIMSIATAQILEGDTLPSVRSVAENIGINMHTVNKAYTLLRQEGYITLDRRRGAVVAPDMDKLRAMEELAKDMRVVVAKAMCKRVTGEEIHDLVNSILDEFGGA